MKAHELGRLLLEGPDEEVVMIDEDWEEGYKVYVRITGVTPVDVTPSDNHTVPAPYVELT